MKVLECELDQDEIEDLLHGRRDNVEFNFDGDIKVIVKAMN